MVIIVIILWKTKAAEPYLAEKFNHFGQISKEGRTSQSCSTWRAFLTISWMQKQMKRDCGAARWARFCFLSRKQCKKPNKRAQTQSSRLTVQVTVQRQEVWPVRAAEWRIVDVFWQRRGHPGQGGALGEAALRRLLFVPSPAVLKPDLQRISERERAAAGRSVWHYAGEVSGCHCGRPVYFGTGCGGFDPITLKGVNV